MLLRGKSLRRLLVCAMFALPGTMAGAQNGAAAKKHTGAVRAGGGKVMSEQAAWRTGQSEELRAGPIRLTFCDGELRGLYVGEREIARRVYFAVRDKNWDTALPKFSHITVQKQADAFTLDLQADCVTATADYHWRAQIKGKADGAITFAASGQAGRDFDSNRIGICLLYGTPALLGQNFQTTGADGKAVKGAFPQNISPKLVAEKFTALRYTADGMTVTASMTGATFDMEDQRNYGDSSFKAYASLPYAYPHIAKGDAKAQELTLRMEHAPPAPLKEKPAEKSAEKVTRLTLGELLPDVTIPKLLTADSADPDVIFGAINFNREKFRNAKELTWGLNPSVHLPDDTTFMENATTIVEQARTAGEFAPGAALHITPIRFDSAHWRTGRDPRSASVFGSAWAARAVKYLAHAKVEDAAFDFGPGQATNALKDLLPFAGHSLYDVKIHAAGSSPIDALAFVGNEGLQFWIINLTNQPQSVTVNNLPQAMCQLARRNGKHPLDAPLDTDPMAGMTGNVTTDLGPYEVCEIQF